MNKYSMIMFLAVFSSIYFGLHYYVYHRISSGLSLTSHQSLYFRIFIYLGALTFFASEILSRRITAGVWGEYASWVGLVWLGILSIAFTCLLLRDLSLIFFHSQNFKHLSVLISLSLICVISVYSLWNAGRQPAVKAIELKSSKLSSEYNGFTIVQLSDIHIDFQTPLWWLRNIVTAANDAKPDVILITGDLIDADLCKKEELCAILRGLKAPRGVFATTGNHEFYVGLEKFTALCAATGIKALRNENTAVGDVFTLAGIDDTQGERFYGTPVDIGKALSNPVNADRTKPIVLASHRPGVFDKAAAAGVDLTLSGHTHWGQIPPVDLFVKLFERYSMGYYRKGDAAIYTTSGTGTWGPPMRLFSRSEIVKIVLRTENRE